MLLNVTFNLIWSKLLRQELQLHVCVTTLDMFSLCWSQILHFLNLQPNSTNICKGQLEVLYKSSGISQILKINMIFLNIKNILTVNPVNRYVDLF